MLFLMRQALVPIIHMKQNLMRDISLDEPVDEGVTEPPVHPVHKPRTSHPVQVNSPAQRIIKKTNRKPVSYTAVLLKLNASALGLNRTQSNITEHTVYD